VLVCEAVFEAVGSVAFVALDAGYQRSVDQRFAAGVCALLLVGQDAWFRG
jgi:hypothetical protein